MATFHWADYLIFSCMLGASASIGVFYAISSRNKNSSKEYTLANRQMSFFPVAMSLLASLFTGIYIQGNVAETYYRGAALVAGSIVPLVISGTFAGRVFMPKFYELRLTSVYQYLDMRFDAYVRNCCLVIGVLYMILHSGIATFAASLVLTTVTGGKLSVIVSAVLLSTVCTFYTVIGGIKAVLWADCFQMCVLFASLLAAVIQGASKLGYTDIWNINAEGGRLNLFQFDPDPRIYATFWTVLIGVTFSWLPTMCVLQYQVQRYLTCRSQKTAHVSFSVFIAGCVAVTVLCVLAGMAVYALYVDCDPHSTGELLHRDGLLPFYILETFQDMPGIPGLLVSGLCSAALSTTSSILNSLATISNEHVIKKFWTDLTDAKYLLITKSIALFFGALNVGTVFLVAQLGDILPAIIGLVGVTNGPVCAVFILGIMSRKANSKGTLIGFIIGIAVGIWIFIGSIFYQDPNSIVLPLSTDGCSMDTAEPVANTTMTVMITNMSEVYSSMSAVPESTNGGFFVELYKVSPLWYSMICIVIVIVVGLVASLIVDAISERPKSEVDDSLLWSWRKSFCCCIKQTDSRVDDKRSLFAVTSDVMSDVTLEGAEPAGVINNVCDVIFDDTKPSETTHL